MHTHTQPLHRILYFEATKSLDFITHPFILFPHSGFSYFSLFLLESQKGGNNLAMICLCNLLSRHSALLSAPLRSPRIKRITRAHTHIEFPTHLCAVCPAAHNKNRHSADVILLNHLLRRRLREIDGGWHPQITRQRQRRGGGG